MSASTAHFDPENVTYLVIDIARLSRAEFERRVAEAGLGVTPAEARVLASLARHAPIRQNVLAERMGIAKMSLTGFLDRLEAAGLVARRPDDHDRRAKVVSPTEASEPVLSELAAIGREVRRTARGDMDDETWTRFRETARTARDNLAAARRRACKREVGA